LSYFADLGQMGPKAWKISAQSWPRVRLAPNKAGNQTMPWSPPTSSGNVVAIHAALVPTANGDGEIILFGGDNHDLAASRAHDFDHGARFNCRTQALITVHLPNFDLFCCGHAFLGDGRLLVAGGTAEFPADAGGPHQGHHFDGHRHCAGYVPALGIFNVVADMGPQPGHGNAGGGRWYPTLCTLGDGEVYAFQGHPSGTDTRHGNDTPERYNAGGNSWAMLPKIGQITGDPILYPRLHLLSDGHLFVTSNINGHNQNIRIDPFGGSAEISRFFRTRPISVSTFRRYSCRWFQAMATGRGSCCAARRNRS
jgi:hypothetical protein